MAPLLAVPPSPSIEVSALATAAMSALLWDVYASQQLLLRYETFSPDYRFAADSLTAAALSAAARFQRAIVGWNLALPAPGSRLQIQYSHDFRTGGRDSDYLAAALGIKL